MTGYEYPHRFINQYARIPRQVANRLDTEFAGEYPGVRHCLGLIATNLLTRGTIAYSRRGNFYSENRTRHYTRANMLKAVEIAERKGYAMSVTGFRSEGYSRGVSSTLTATEGLRREFEPIRRLELDVELLPLLVVDGRPAFAIGAIDTIKSKCQWLLATGALDPPTTYDATYKLNRGYFNLMRVDYRNLRLEGDYLEVVGLTRVFKEGGVGRWFQKGGLSYQGLSGEDRAELLLNGEEVVELDYPAMHPHILHAWEGEQCPKDFYERVADLCGCFRFVAKSIVLFAVNAPSYASLSSAVNLDKAKETKANLGRAEPKPILYDELKRQGLRPNDVVNAISEAHPTIAKYIFSGSAIRLMLAESDIMTSALLRLMDLGIPSLPVHDSLIAPRRHRGRVREVMEEAYNQHTGFSITVE
ncbi:hypothetical protein ES703_68544 [subsurface metagenome]